MIYGNSASVLGGTTSWWMPEESEWRIMARMLDVISHMVHAEALQLEMRNTFRPDVDPIVKSFGQDGSAVPMGATAGGPLVDSRMQKSSILGCGAKPRYDFPVMMTTLTYAVTQKKPQRYVSRPARRQPTWPMIRPPRPPELLLSLRQYASSSNEPTQADAAALVSQQRQRA